MRRLLAFIVVAVLALAPAAARAEAMAAEAMVAEATLMPVPVQIVPAGPTIFGLPADQAASVGLGIVAGVVAMQVVVGSSAGVIVGGMAGALLGTWWYANYGLTAGPLSGAVDSQGLEPAPLTGPRI